jgi:lipid-binding SYLF domain-containing protein
MMTAEMLSYSRSHGIFAGISLDGATLRPDGETNRELYGADVSNRDILSADIKVPVAAVRFENVLNHDSNQPNR